jgi:uncharacterized linocin/CFP29 family protein
MEFLHREEAPLNSLQWKELDKVVVNSAKSHLIGRRFIEITISADPAIQSIAYDTISGTTTGACGLFEGNECDIVKVKDRKFLPIPQIYKDFKIHWRDIETSKKLGIPLDFSVAAAAAKEVATAEDRFIFNGNKELGYPGILNVEGRNIIKKDNFSKEGGIFKTAVKCVETLNSQGFNSNLVFILNPKDYSKAFRLFGNSGVLEINQIKELFDFGVFSTYAVPEGTVVALSTGLENMDLVIAQDIITAYLAYDNMEHYFRVFELIAFRIKNPVSICTAE